MSNSLSLRGSEPIGPTPVSRPVDSRSRSQAGDPFDLGSILLVEADAELRDSRRLLLGVLQHPVLAVGAYLDVCMLPADSNCCLVVIGTHPSVHEAVRIAVHTRRTWPRAKILLLGTCFEAFDDPQYDDAVDPRCNPSGVVEAARRLLRNDYRLLRHDRNPGE